MEEQERGDWKKGIKTGWAWKEKTLSHAKGYKQTACWQNCTKTPSENPPVSQDAEINDRTMLQQLPQRTVFTDQKSHDKTEAEPISLSLCFVKKSQTFCQIL